MLTKEWKSLKSGSDIRGVGVSGMGAPVTLTDEVVERVGVAFAGFLAARTGKPVADLRISVGRDSRISGPRIRNAVVRGMCFAGAKVFDCGLTSTPSMFMSTITPGFDYDGAVMITASHMPMDKNGLKFFTKQGGVEGSDILTLLEMAQDEQRLVTGDPVAEEVDFLSVYAQQLVDKVRAAVPGVAEPLSGFRIVVDAGNGAGGFYVDKVLKPLGANTAGSQYLDPDGRFPNHIPNPENEEAMAAIQQAVLTAKADLGIIFDTDVDRAGAVDDAGREINRNRLVALMSAIMIEETPGATIVTDSITSTGLAAFIAQKGGKHHRFKRGYRNVIDEALRLNAQGIACPMAMETSGHCALKENHFLDDGAYLITKLLIKMAQLKTQGRKLSDLIADLAEPAESAEVRMGIQGEGFAEYGQQVIARVEACAQAQGWAIAPDNHEGIRVSFGPGEGEGWFLLRLSLHDPIMPLNVESDAPGGVKVIAAKLYDALKQFDRLDTGKLQAIL